MADNFRKWAIKPYNTETIRSKLLYSCIMVLCYLSVTARVHAKPMSSNTLSLALICDTYNESSLALSDHISVELSSLQGVRLLERSEIRRILAEQNIALKSNASGDNMLTIGKICGADLLVFLIPRKTMMSCKIVDIRNGRILQTAVYSMDESNYQQNLQTITSGINKSVKQLTLPADLCSSVVVTTFINRDVNRKHDDLQEIMPELICMYLGYAPNIILLERDHTYQINTEINRNSDSKTQVELADLIISGGFSIHRKGADKQIEVILNFTNIGKQSPRQMQFTGQFGALEDIAQEIANAIIKDVHGSSLENTTPNKPEEALYFFLKGQRFQQLGQDLKALSMFETAHFLAPNKPEHSKALSDTQLRIAFKGIKPTDSPGLKERKIDWYILNAKTVEACYRSNPKSANRAQEEIFRLGNLYVGSRAEDYYYQTVLARLNGLEYCIKQEIIKTADSHSKLLAHMDPDIAQWEEMKAGTYCMKINMTATPAILNTQDTRTYSKHFFDVYGYYRRLYTDLATTPAGKDVALKEMVRYIQKISSKARMDNRETNSGNRKIYRNKDCASRDIFRKLLEEDMPEINLIIQAQNLYNDCVTYTPQKKEIRNRLSKLVDLLFIPEINCGSAAQTIYRNLYTVSINHLEGGYDLSYIVSLLSQASKNQNDKILTPHAAGLAYYFIDIWLDGRAFKTPTTLWAEIVPPYLKYMNKTNHEQALKVAKRITRYLDTQKETHEIIALKKEVAECVSINAEQLSSPKPKKTDTFIETSAERYIFRLSDFSGRKFPLRWFSCYAIIRSTNLLHMVCERAGGSAPAQLVTYNLKTDIITTGDILDTPFKLPDPRYYDRQGVDIIKLSDRIIICVAKKGIAEFKFNGNSRLLTADDGLPVKDILCMAYQGANVYVGSAGGIGRWTPSKKNFELLYSNRFPSDGHPLNGGKPYTVRDIEYDQYHNRLIFVLTGSRTGLWSFSLSSGKAEKIHDFSCWNLRTPYRNGDWLFIGNPLFLIMYNIRNPEQTKAIVHHHNCKKDLGIKLQPIAKVVKTKCHLTWYPAILMNDRLIYKTVNYELSVWKPNTGETKIKTKQHYSSATCMMLPYKKGIIQVRGTNIMYFEF